MRLAGGVGDRRRPGRQRRRHQRVLGAHHRGLVHEDRAGAQPAARRLQLDPAAPVDGGAEVGEGVEVGVEPAAADEVAAGRRHARLAEAGQQRAGEQERGADLLRELLVDGHVRNRRRAEAQAVVADPLGLDAEPLQQRDLRFRVADSRHPVQQQLLLGQQAGGEDRQGRVLVAGGRQLARERHASFDDELLHVAARVLPQWDGDGRSRSASWPAWRCCSASTRWSPRAKRRAPKSTSPAVASCSCAAATSRSSKEGPRDAPTILLVHCFSCAINWWDGMMPRLDRTHRVIAVDLLGHGGSEKPSSGYTIPNQADLVAQALARLHARNVEAVGHSLGGSRRHRTGRTLAAAGRTGRDRRHAADPPRGLAGLDRKRGVRARDRPRAMADQAGLLGAQGTRGRLRARLRRARRIRRRRQRG